VAVSKNMVTAVISTFNEEKTIGGMFLLTGRVCLFSPPMWRFYVELVNVLGFSLDSCLG